MARYINQPNCVYKKNVVDISSPSHDFNILKTKNKQTNKKNKMKKIKKTTKKIIL